MKQITKEEFVRAYAEHSRIPMAAFPALRLRPYRCRCGGVGCIGWQMVHDNQVRFAVAAGDVDEAECRAYFKELGARYNTTPWVEAVTTEQPS